jgi:hypothetical protein
VCSDELIRMHLLLPVASPASQDHKIIGFAGVRESDNRAVIPTPQHDIPPTLRFLASTARV